jgi:hypothetical protein
MAVVFGGGGSEGLPRPGNTAILHKQTGYGSSLPNAAQGVI